MADKAAPRGSAMLLTIPPEIQFHILSFFVPSSLGSVHAVLYTCKSLYNVALPLSVHTYRNPHPDEVCGTPTRRRNLDFLRYIAITKPSLAPYVKNIMLDNVSALGLKIGNSDRWALGATSAEVEVFANRVLDIFGSKTDPLSHDWYLVYQELLEGLSNGVQDAEIALLLMLCSRLESLAFGHPIALQLLVRLIDAARDNPPESHILPASTNRSIQLLSCLRSVYHEAGNLQLEQPGFSRPAKAFFQLPRVSSYECLLADGNNHAYDDFASIPKGSSSIESITLRKSRLNPDTLHAMFAACKSLRSFEYIRGGIKEMDTNEVRPRDLMSAALTHAKTLESLHANFEHGWQKAAWAEEEESKEELCVGRGLQKLLALKSLTIGMPALTGMTLDQIGHTSSVGDSSPLETELAPTMLQCLPENLEDLQIHSCGPQILAQAQKFLDTVAAGKRFRKLKVVRFLFEEEQIRNSVMALTCSEPDIQVEVVTQTLGNREFDHVPYAMGFSASINTLFMCSPMATRGDRELWLQCRGSNRGSASHVTGRVYQLPDE